jgi:hypothetical protein
MRGTAKCEDGSGAWACAYTEGSAKGTAGTSTLAGAGAGGGAGAATASGAGPSETPWVPGLARSGAQRTGVTVHAQEGEEEGPTMPWACTATAIAAESAAKWWGAGSGMGDADPAGPGIPPTSLPVPEARPGWCIQSGLPVQDPNMSPEKDSKPKEDSRLAVPKAVPPDPSQVMGYATHRLSHQAPAPAPDPDPGTGRGTPPRMPVPLPPPAMLFFRAAR